MTNDPPATFRPTDGDGEHVHRAPRLNGSIFICFARSPPMRK